MKKSPRNAIFYFSDDGEIMAIRNGDYKFVLAEQRGTSTTVWQEPLVKLRIPKIYNLRRDPFERADFNSNVYWDWMVDHVFHDVRDASAGGGADRGFRQVPAAAEAGFVQPGRRFGAGVDATAHS